MTFAAGERLFALALLPLVLAAYLRSRQRRRLRVAALAGQGLVSRQVSENRSWRAYLPFLLFLVSLGLLVVASARPMVTVKTPRREATVVLAIDISNSMAATDVKPSRIGAAKVAATAFVRRQPAGVRVGVVAFGAGAAVVQAPTFAHNDVLRAIDHLTLGGGTSMAAGILTSLDAIAGKTLVVNEPALGQDDSGEVDTGYYGGATIVVFSDGEDTSQVDPVTMARLASVAGVRVDTVGVGTVAGTTVQVDGFSIATAMDTQTLQSVASVTNGSFHLVGDPSAVEAISRSIGLHFSVVTQYTEVTAVFAAAAVILLLTGTLVSVMRHGRVLS